MSIRNDIVFVTIMHPTLVRLLKRKALGETSSSKVETFEPPTRRQNPQKQQA